jgi:hypothetical protein
VSGADELFIYYRSRNAAGTCNIVMKKLFIVAFACARTFDTNQVNGSRPSCGLSLPRTR